MPITGACSGVILVCQSAGFLWAYIPSVWIRQSEIFQIFIFQSLRLTMMNCVRSHRSAALCGLVNLKTCIHYDFWPSCACSQLTRDWMHGTHFHIVFYFIIPLQEFDLHFCCTNSWRKFIFEYQRISFKPLYSGFVRNDFVSCEQYFSTIRIVRFVT